MDVNAVVKRLRRYAIVREFASYTTFEGLSGTSAATAMSKSDIEGAIRDRMKRKGAR